MIVQGLLSRMFDAARESLKTLAQDFAFNAHTNGNHEQAAFWGRTAERLRYPAHDAKIRYIMEQEQREIDAEVAAMPSHDDEPWFQSYERTKKLQQEIRDKWAKMTPEEKDRSLDRAVENFKAGWLEGHRIMREQEQSAQKTEETPALEV